jgi:hypothetical protein
MNGRRGKAGRGRKRIETSRQRMPGDNIIEQKEIDP